jgi:plastocyanin
VVANNAGANESTRNYQPPTLSLVFGVNNSVAWTDEDSGFELHVISVAVPPGGLQWDLNMTDTPGENTQCVLLTAPGTYTYEIFVPYVVAGTIVVKSSTSSTAG